MWDARSIKGQTRPELGVRPRRFIVASGSGSMPSPRTPCRCSDTSKTRRIVFEAGHRCSLQLQYKNFSHFGARSAVALVMPTAAIGPA